MIVVQTSSLFDATYESGQTGLSGIAEVQIADGDGIVVLGPFVVTIEIESTGIYVAQLTAPGTQGQYSVVFSPDGLFDPETVATEDLVVIAGAVTPNLPPIPDPGTFGPTDGPCYAWCSPDQVAEVCDSGVGTYTELLEPAVAAASEALFQASARRFTGFCSQTARPCAPRCGCWPLTPGITAMPSDPISWVWGFWGTGWGYGSAGCSTPYGCCGALPRVLLPGYPVTSIVEVKIDGVVLAATDGDGLPNYRLDEWRYLTRMSDSDHNTRYWPACQDLSLPDTESGTWSVTYTYGQSPPELGQMAAIQLACEIYKALHGADCALPAGTTRLIRQGITIEKLATLTWGFLAAANGRGQWKTGLPIVDLFLNSVNPAGLIRRPTIWAPGSPQYARLVGS